jgi:hypothetical protein
MQFKPPRWRRWFVSLILVVLVAEALYAASVVIFLNTPLFALATGMQNETETHVRARGAWSIVPGRVYAREVLVAIRDPNVKIDVRLRRARIPFSISALFRKRFVVDGLVVPRVEVDVHLRSEKERRRYLAEHPDPKRHLEPTDAEIAEMKATKWIVRIPRLRLELVDPIAFGENSFRGQTTIEGGFELQPGVEAEIFPTRVRFANGKWDETLSNLQGEATVRFHRFSAPRVSGNAVFDYVDADVKAAGRTESLQFVNLTLRSLEGFGFTNGHTDFASEIIVRRGRLRPKSYFQTPDGALELRNPTFFLRGNGFVRWRIEKDDGTSQLLFLLRDGKTRADLADTRVQGGADRIAVEARIYGVDLKNPFTGLTGGLSVSKGHYEIHSVRGMPWNAIGKVEGSIAGLTEGAALPATARAADGLRVTIDRSHFGVPFPGGRPLPVAAKGKLKISGQTLVLTRRSTLPSVALDLLVAKEPGAKDNREWKPARLTLRTDGARRTLGVAGTHWSGAARLRVRGLNEILDQLQDAKLLSKTLRVAADARRLDAKLSWEVRPTRTNFRADSITTDGTWSATAELGRQNDGKWLGLIDAKVLGVPIGVALAPNQTEWKILPTTAEEKISAKWVNGRAAESDSKAASKTPDSSPLRKTQ